MDTPLVMTLAAAVGLVIGAMGGFVFGRSRERARREQDKVQARDEASLILKRAEEEAENLRKAGELAGREEGFRLREAWEGEETRRREEVERSERRIDERSDAMDRQFERLSGREADLEERTTRVATREKELDDLEADVQRRPARGWRSWRESRPRKRSGSSPKLSRTRPVPTPRTGFARSRRRPSARPIARPVRSWPSPSSAWPRTRRLRRRCPSSSSLPMR
jgi:hypothetical protein